MSPMQVNFRWAVNTSKGLTDFEPTRYSTSGTSSLLTYRPYSYQIAEIHDRAEEEGEGEENLPAAVESFGTVFCWAQNRVGWQKEPCVFSVKPAGELRLCNVPEYFLLC